MGPLLAPLQWAVVALVIGGVMRIGIGPFSTGLVALLMLSWVAWDVRSLCPSRTPRLWSLAVAVGAIVTAVVNIVSPPTILGATVDHAVAAVFAATVVTAFASIAGAFKMSNRERWARLSWAAWPAALSFTVVDIVSGQVGRPVAPFRSGWTYSIGDVDYALPGWVWLITVVGVAPAAAVGILSMLAFIRSYREVKASNNDRPPVATP